MWESRTVLPRTSLCGSLSATLPSAGNLQKYKFTMHKSNAHVLPAAVSDGGLILKDPLEARRWLG